MFFKHFVPPEIFFLFYNHTFLFFSFFTFLENIKLVIKWMKLMSKNVDRSKYFTKNYKINCLYVTMVNNKKWQSQNIKLIFILRLFSSQFIYCIFRAEINNCKMQNNFKNTNGWQINKKNKKKGQMSHCCKKYKSTNAILLVRLFQFRSQITATINLYTHALVWWFMVDMYTVYIYVYIQSVVYFFAIFFLSFFLVSFLRTEEQFFYAWPRL